MIDNCVNNINKLYESLEVFVDKIINEYGSELDDYICRIREGLQEDPSLFTDDELERLVIKLPELLYWVSVGVEQLGAKEDLSKIVKTTAYNRAVKDAACNEVEKKLTASEKAAYANEKSQEEQLTYIIFNHASKQLKARLDLGTEMLQSIKKIISARMLDKEITRSSNLPYNPKSPKEK